MVNNWTDDDMKITTKDNGDGEANRDIVIKIESLISICEDSPKYYQISRQLEFKHICNECDDSSNDKRKLNPHLITVHNEIINLILKENSDSSKTSLNQGLKEFVKDEIPDILLKSVPTKFIGQGRKIRKSHQGCNRIWMHYEHEVQGCTICTDAFIEKWEIVADIKSEKAVNQKSKLTIFWCMLKFDRNFR